MTRATPVEYAIDVHLTLLRGTNAALIQAAALSRLNDYAQARRQRLGRDVVRADITARTQAIEGVYDTQIFSPSAAVGITPHQFAVATGVQVTIDGVTDG